MLNYSVAELRFISFYEYLASINFLAYFNHSLFFLAQYIPFDFGNKVYE